MTTTHAVYAPQAVDNADGREVVLGGQQAKAIPGLTEFDPNAAPGAPPARDELVPSSSSCARLRQFEVKGAR